MYADQDRRISRQRRGITGHVDNVARRRFAKRLDDFHGTVARRVDEHPVERRNPLPVHCRDFEQIANGKFAFRLEPVQFRILAGALHKPFVSLDAQHVCTTPCDGQGKISQPAKQVGDAFARLRIEQRDGAANEYAVYLVIDLREISRIKRKRQVEIGNVVAQLGSIDGMKRHGGVRPLALQKKTDAMYVGELAQLDFKSPSPAPFYLE